MVPLSDLGLDDGRKRQIGKWSEKPLLITADLKLVSINELVRMQSITVAVFIVTLGGLFIVKLNYFGRLNFKTLPTFVSWPNKLRLKSPAIWIYLLQLLGQEKNVVNKFSNCSYCPTGGLYKKLT